jgi:hypothetical protein
LIAKLVRIKEVGDNDGHRYSFLAKQRFRGEIPPSFTVWEENNSGRARFSWKTNQDYLLFLSYSDRDHAWIMDGCGNSGLVHRSAKALAEVQRLGAKPREGVVSGIVTTDSWTTGVPGVTVTALRQDKALRVTSDREGRFEFKLEPGTYQFKAYQNGKPFRPGSYSYERTDQLVVRPGSCSQIQFEQP